MGITKEVVQEAVHKAVSTAKNYVFEQLDQLTEDTKGEFSSELDKFSRETVDSIVSTATATVLDPLRNLSLSLSNTVARDEAYVKGRIEDGIRGEKGGKSGVGFCERGNSETDQRSHGQDDDEN